MPKKKKRGARKSSRAKRRVSRPKKHRKLVLTSLLGLVALLVVGSIYYFVRQPSKVSDPDLVRVTNAPSGLLEKRPTLSPALFTGKVRRSYQIAREIPEALDQLYCYCRCKENLNHLSLLTCYTNNHAAT